MNKQLFFCFLCLFLLSSISSATLFFKIDCVNPVMNVNDERTLTISAYGDTLAADFGLHSWQLDLAASSGDGGAVQAVSATVLEPMPNYDAGYLSIDTPPGAVNWLGAVVLDGSQVSNVGVGGYTPIAEVVIKGVSEGTVVYSLGDFGGGFYGVDRSGNQLSVDFNADSSTLTYLIVPEPSSLVLLSGLGLWGALRRRKA